MVEPIEAKQDENMTARFLADNAAFSADILPIVKD
jgi:hypothetical protein